MVKVPLLGELGELMAGKLWAVSSVPNWGILEPRSGMTLPPAPVSTLHLRVTSLFGPISAGISTVAKASVVESI